MAIKQFKPTTPARRGMTSRDTETLTTKNSKSVPKKLKVIKKQNAGRNNQGRITTRHRGGGRKRFYRIVNFDIADGFKGVVEEIEYDPNRSAYLARVKDQDGQYHYVLANAGIKVGSKIEAGEDVDIEAGNRLELKNIPDGSIINSIELTPGSGAKMVRSAGVSAQLVAKDEKNAQIKLPSGEIRIVNLSCRATLGSIGNEQHQNVQLGSAGRVRRMGRRPQVRGKAMNAVDHPHGGGDGGAHGVGRDPKTPWGQKTLGYKTRRRKSSNNMILKSRHESKRR